MKNYLFIFFSIVFLLFMNSEILMADRVDYISKSILDKKIFNQETIYENCFSIDRRKSVAKLSIEVFGVFQEGKTAVVFFSYCNSNNNNCYQDKEQFLRLNSGIWWVPQRHYYLVSYD